MIDSPRDTVSALHPMLAGHFPGNPVVPGAFLLSWVIAHARPWLAGQGDRRVIAGVSRVKFQRPLRPGESFCCTWTAATESLRFVLASDAGIIATGTLMLHPTRTP